ncbi:hypothetical protein JHK82_014288 [Glycine max]|nr:hypothetical protein JHK87_014196 [Glycine soja]KAG5030681.1 hypothetical protein JHK85_014663 [Glycine max]KAG5044907.1 hypothetical protein JHK86_014313 [Glycine max]KAG5147407.1 hypothetical protein JHK82_014288 [Glycine max]KHN22300.1 hypothetical protein glysoja_022056 [Glycine soja]
MSCIYKTIEDKFDDQFSVLRKPDECPFTTHYQYFETKTRIYSLCLLVCYLLA